MTVWLRTYSPELVYVQNRGKTALVVMHRDQLVLVEQEEAEPRLLEHAILLLLALSTLQVGGDLYGTQVAAGPHVEEGEALGIGGCEEGAVGVDAYGLVAGHAVATEIQIDRVQAALGVRVDLKLMTR